MAIVASSQQDVQHPAPVGRGKQTVKFLIITLLLVGSLWYVLRDVEWSKLWEAILQVNLWWIVVGSLVTLGSHIVRAERWRALIPNGRIISLLDAFSATIIGYLMNNIIPRSGEIIRPYILGKRIKRSTSSLVATVVVERILDGLTLLLLFFTLLFTASNQIDQVLPDGYTASGILISLALPVLLLIIGLIIVLGTSFGDKFVSLLEVKLPEKIGRKIRELFDEFRAGIGFGGTKGLVRILLLTIPVWLGYAFAFYFGFLAFGFDVTYGMGLTDMVTLLAITAVGMTIAPTPGGFGVFHLFCRITLVSLYGIPEDQAVAFALVTHAGQYLIVMIVGAFFFFREGVSFGEATHKGTHPEEVEGAV